MISMAEATLGWPGRVFAWIVYLFLFYCLTVAYIDGGGNLVQEFSGGMIAEFPATCLFVLLFAPFVYLGAWAVDRVNWILMAGLGISYFLFVAFGFQGIRYDYLARSDWSYMFVALPIAFASFGFQGILPTLVNYLDHDAKKVRQAIFIGCAIPLVIYILWELLILGLIPLEGPGGLREAYAEGVSAVHPLRTLLGSSLVHGIAQVFAFCALVTSFFGVTLGLLDFLADGLQVRKTSKGKALLCLLIFVPPVLLSYGSTGGLFLKALDFAGGFGGALLLGLLPILMVWRGRYTQGRQGERQLGGGKFLLTALALFVLLEVFYELFHI